MTHRYRFAHLHLSTTTPLPELAPADPATEPSDLTVLGEHEVDDFTWDGGGRPLFADEDTDLGPPGLTIHRGRDGWAFVVGETARYHLSEDLRLLVGGPAPAGAPPEDVRHALLDQVLPYVLALRGETVLHASAAVVDGFAVGFLGASGMGKSTLAASLGRAGHPVLADDCTVVRWTGGVPTLVSSYAGLRLWPETVQHVLGDDETGRAPMGPDSSKVRARPETLPFAGDGVELRALLVIGDAPDHDPAAVLVEPLRVGEATLALIESSFVLAETPADKTAIFDRFTALASAVAVGRITVPDDFSLLPAVTEAAIDWCRRAGAGSVGVAPQ
jgi:hypothetical protein